jgi:hypothetical protein
VTVIAWGRARALSTAGNQSSPLTASIRNGDDLSLFPKVAFSLVAVRSNVLFREWHFDPRRERAIFIFEQTTDYCSKRLIWIVKKK